MRSDGKEGWGRVMADYDLAVRGEVVPPGYPAALPRSSLSVGLPFTLEEHVGTPRRPRGRSHIGDVRFGSKQLARHWSPGERDRVVGHPFHNASERPAPPDWSRGRRKEGQLRRGVRR
jgi:hypothetical protein